MSFLKRQLFTKNNINLKYILWHYSRIMHNSTQWIAAPTCLRMIAKYYGRNYTLQTLRSKSFITREGVSMLGISDAAESIGFRTTGLRTTFNQLAEEKPFPCILHWNQNHFVVCYDIKEKKRL